MGVGSLWVSWFQGSGITVGMGCPGWQEGNVSGGDGFRRGSGLGWLRRRSVARIYKCGPVRHGVRACNGATGLGGAKFMESNHGRETGAGTQVRHFRVGTTGLTPIGKTHRSAPTVRVSGLETQKRCPAGLANLTGKHPNTDNRAVAQSRPAHFAGLTSMASLTSQDLPAGITAVDAFLGKSAARR